MRAKLNAALGIAGQLLARIAELEATAERGYERYAELRTLYLDVLGRGAPEAEIAAAAERRGYERAVARLRDDARYTDWWSALPPTDPEHRYWQRGRVQLADYLDAVKESNDGR